VPNEREDGRLRERPATGWRAHDRPHRPRRSLGRLPIRRLQVRRDDRRL